MLDFLRSIFPSLNLSPRTEPKKPGVRRQFEYGNGLNLKTSSLRVKKRVRFGFEWSPLLQNDEFDEEKGGTKLKILMRKEAASRLLSKCKDGGILEYDDVAHDLKAMPGSYVRVLSYNAKDE